MSYDLTVFSPDAAPKTRPEFLSWFRKEAKWGEGHSYDDPSVTSEGLRNWFMDMISIFPALNGPYKQENFDEFVTDYCIGKNLIYAGFRWSVSKKAYPEMKRLAEKHKVGFYDNSGDGDIFFPDDNGTNKPIARTGESTEKSSLEHLLEDLQEIVKDRKIAVNGIDLNQKKR